jgi:hypothetical protein
MRFKVESPIVRTGFFLLLSVLTFSHGSLNSFPSSGRALHRQPPCIHFTFLSLSQTHIGFIIISSFMKSTLGEKKIHCHYLCASVSVRSSLLYYMWMAIHYTMFPPCPFIHYDDDYYTLPGCFFRHPKFMHFSFVHCVNAAKNSCHEESCIIRKCQVLRGHASILNLLPNFSF